MSRTPAPAVCARCQVELDVIWTGPDLGEERVIPCDCTT